MFVTDIVHVFIKRPILLIFFTDSADRFLNLVFQVVFSDFMFAICYLLEEILSLNNCDYLVVLQ